jgi:hypothetical protein
MAAPARWWAADETRAAETAADKRLYVEVGLAPVRCGACGSEVLVKKYSEKHTSVQWTADPASSCPEFAAAVAAGRRSAELLGCPRLKESIAAAVESGRLVVPRD